MAKAGWLCAAWTSGVLTACLVPGLEVGADADRGGTSSGGGSGKANQAIGGTDEPAAGGEGAESSGGSVQGSAGKTASGGNSGVGGSLDGGSSNGGMPTAAGTAGADNGGAAGDGGSAGGIGGSGGSSAGTGGTTSGSEECKGALIPAKSTWVPLASHSSLGNGTEADMLFTPPSHLHDGALNERWSTGKAQSGDEWFQIDFGIPITFNHLVLRLGTFPNDYPRQYEVRVSNTSQNNGAPVRASGTGAQGADTVVDFASPVSGRYLLVKQVGDATATFSWWSVAEVDASCE